MLNVPAIERPEVDTLAELAENEVQPGNPGIGGLGHLPLHIEMKNRLRASSLLLGQPPPA